MKPLSFLSIFLLATSTFSSTMLAQEAELSLYNKITASIAKGEPEWKLNRKALLPNQVIIRWTSEKGRALVSVVLLPSDTAAVGELKSKVEMWEHLPESKISKYELKDFGDEGYILSKAGVSGANIFFRKGRYVVDVTGPSDEVARKFAQHISDLLPTSNSTMDSPGSVPHKLANSP